MKALSYYLLGLTFGAGLVVSGLARPDVILGFLDLGGAWDPTLLIAMAAAVATNAVLVRAAKAQAPATPTRIDARLLAGASIFGLGWGLAGYCPGPAFVGIGSGSSSARVFFVGMTGWMLLARRKRDALPAALGRASTVACPPSV